MLEQAEKLGIPIRVVESDGSELIAVKRIDLAPATSPLSTKKGWPSCSESVAIWP